MEIIDFIICDDIRFEVGGKRSFIGVAEEVFQMQVPDDDNWPKAISFGLSVKGLLSQEEIDKNPESFELLIKIDEEEIHIGDAKFPSAPVNKERPSKLSIGVVVKTFPIKKPGKLTAVLIVRDSNKKTIAKTESRNAVIIQPAIMELGLREQTGQ